MTTESIELPPKLIPVFSGKAYVRGSHGGRGSAKTMSFAKMAAVRAYMWGKAGRKGLIVCARQFMNSLEDSSLEEIRTAIESEPWLAEYFDIGIKTIRTIDGNITFSFTGLTRNINSIKSKSKILLCWVEEAEDVTEEAWVKLIPTLREEDSELWITWNPEEEHSATNQRFHSKLATPDPMHKIVEMNWRDNSYFPQILERQRIKDKIERPDSYGHIWEGEFKTHYEGAYFSQGLREMAADGRIKRVPRDPIFRLRAFWDLGGRGAKSDHTVIWIAQFVEKEVRVIDYYIARGQTLATHIAWLERKGYETALCYLPHDGAPKSPIADASWATTLEDAGYEVEVVPNQGAGAAMMRIEAARNLFPSIVMDEERTKHGRNWIGKYAPKYDEEKRIDLGPNHNDYSHPADAFGMMCQCFEPPMTVEEVVIDDAWVV